MILLDRKDMKNIFSMQEAVEACKTAFRTFSAGESIVPLRTNISVPEHEGLTLFMPGYVEPLDAAGVKIVSVYPKNKKKELPSVSATMVLIDSTTGEVCCILDGTYLTQLRTGAAAGAATDVLARNDAKIGALIGTGGQALSQLEAMLTVRKLAEVRIYSRNKSNAEKFIDLAKTGLDFTKTRLIAVSTSDEAIIEADIITTVTTSKKPVFDGKKVKKGAHINGVGSFMPDMQELDEEIINRADKIFFDSLDAVLAEAGDFIIPLEKGNINKEKISGELGQILVGKLKGRESENEITLFKTVGIAVQDIVTANEIYKNALIKKSGYEYIF